MSWNWRYESGDGTQIDGRDFAADLSAGAERSRDNSLVFPTQADAESWLGENWRDLLDRGVEQVTLLEDDRVEYGPMSLRPPV
jgi:hypothetical protein